MSLNESQLKAMLDLQDGMNSKVNPDWVAANNNWYRAILVESVEAIEHHGWKWWKHQECDMAQLRMELVDIWHFVLSAFIQEKYGNLNLARMEMLAEFNLRQKSVHFDNKYHAVAQLSLLEKLDILAGLAASKRVNLALFEALLADCGMTWGDLFAQYTGKNVLNMFRQDHGYKSGGYIKVWDGREDNEHLVEIMQLVDVDSESVGTEIYEMLVKRYETLG